MDLSTKIVKKFVKKCVDMPSFLWYNTRVGGGICTRSRAAHFFTFRLCTSVLPHAYVTHFTFRLCTLAPVGAKMGLVKN